MLPVLFTIIGVVIIILGVVFLLFFFLTAFSLAPWVPARRKDRERINKLASLSPGQRFIELGSGDGRICRYIAKKNPAVQVVGIELSIFVYLWGRIINLFIRRKNLKLKFGDALKEDLSQYDVIYTYAFTESINGRLKDKFIKELKKEAKVISYLFSIKDWPGRSFIDQPDSKSLAINIYKP